MAASDKFSLAIVFKVLDKASGPLVKVGRKFKSLRTPVLQVKRSLRALATDPSWANLRRQASRVNKSFVKTFAVMGAGISRINARIKTVGASLRMAALPLLAIGGFAIRSAVRFQSAMNMVGAVANATGKEFDRLQTQAMDLGRTTQFTAVQAAQGMQFLAMAGLRTNEIVGAMPRVLELAASAQMDLGQSANIVTNIMKGFGLETKDLARVNDVLVNAFTNSNVDLAMLGQTMKFVGPVMKSMGQDLETAAATAGMLGNAGIQGSMAGTSMRQGMLSLASPTKKATKLMKKHGVQIFRMKDGTLDLIKTLKGFKKAGFGIEDIAKIVDKRAAPAFQVLMDSIDFLPDFIEKLRTTGTAARVAEAQMKGLPGAFRALKSAWEGLSISMVKGDVSGGLGNLVWGMTDFLRKSSEADSWLVKLGESIRGVVNTEDPIIAWALAVGTALVALNTTLGKTALAFIVIIAGVQTLAASRRNLDILAAGKKAEALGIQIEAAEKKGSDKVEVFTGKFDVAGQAIMETTPLFDARRRKREAEKLAAEDLVNVFDTPFGRTAIKLFETFGEIQARVPSESGGRGGEITTGSEQSVFGFTGQTRGVPELARTGPSSASELVVRLSAGLEGRLDKALAALNVTVEEEGEASFAGAYNAE